MEIARYIRAGLHFANAVLPLFLHHVIRAYHLKKPLGMQTFLGRVTILCLWILSFSVTFGSVTMFLAELFSPFNEVTATIFTIPGNIHYNFCLGFRLSICLLAVFLVHVSLISLIFTILMTKYLSIYHSHWIQALNEEKAIRYLTMILLLLPIFLVSIELAYLSNIEDLSTYQFLLLGTVTSSGKSEIMTTLLHMINFALAIILQVRNELDHHTYNESYGCLHAIRQCCRFRETGNASNDNDNDSQLSLIRQAFGVCALLTSIAIYHMTIGAQNLKNTFAICGFIFHCGIPGLFIYNHKSIRALAVSIIQGWLPDPYFTITI